MKLLWDPRDYIAANCNTLVINRTNDCFQVEVEDQESLPFVCHECKWKTKAEQTYFEDCYFVIGILELDTYLFL